MDTRTDPRPGTGRAARRFRGRLVVLTAVVAFVGAACAPPSPPAGPGGGEIDFGPLTLPLPPIEMRAPATNINVLGICNISYRPPGVNIIGATVTIPGIRIDPNQPIITVPNVTVKIPQLRIPLSTINACGLLQLQVDALIPSTVNVQAATLNLAARTITLQNPSLTLNGVGLGIPGLGDLVIPLPPIALPLPTAAIAF